MGLCFVFPMRQYLQLEEKQPTTLVDNGMSHTGGRVHQFSEQIHFEYSYVASE